MRIVKEIKTWMHNKRFYANSIGLAQEEFECAKRLSLPKLSVGEKKAVNNIWEGVNNNLSIGYPGFAVYKNYYGFNAEYVPMSYAFPWLLRVLSRIDYARVFVNKSMAYNYFYNVNLPKLIGYVVNGCFFLDRKIVDKQQFIEGIAKYHCEKIVKLSTGSCGGKSIKFLSASSDIAEVSSIVNSYRGDFLIQEKISQHPFTAQFNASSLNTFRISTLLINGKFSVCTAMLRFGNSDSIVDNLGSGGGCVGVNDDGTLMSIGFDYQCCQIDEWNGVRFNGLHVPNFESVLEVCRTAHFDIPMCAFVGWDIALCDDGSVKLIEANIDIPGVFFEQLANARPLFRDRFKEVMTYIREHPLPLEPLYDATN